MVRQIPMVPSVVARGSASVETVTNGLYHYGQRYYDPTTGRWTQQDPLDRLGSTAQGNRFLFAGDDPINLSDPSGRSVEGYAEDCATGIAYGSAPCFMLLSRSR